VSERPLVVVLGTGADDPPPGIEAAEPHVELRYAPDGDALPRALRGADALFFWRAEGGWLRDAWQHAAGLRWIQSASDGVDALMFPALIASGVEVTNARGVFDEAIAEWVIGAMLAFAARIIDQRDRQLRGVWDGTTRERLAGSRLLVVGPGPIGRATAQRALALGVEVEGAGRSAREDDLFGPIVATGDAESFRVALGRADHVLDALPLTPATRALFDARVFAAMRPSARFYNVGRGDTVDEPALVDALERGAIAGAGLDVFVEEPLPAGSRLWAMPQVLLSPHMCGDVEGWEAEVVDIFVENAARFALGGPLRNRVDTAAGFGIG
jgi:phosphoglycerate dehydrogenase-like enzyme